jgi:hypothetical protein
MAGIVATVVLLGGLFATMATTSAWAGTTPANGIAVQPLPAGALRQVPASLPSPAPTPSTWHFRVDREDGSSTGGLLNSGTYANFTDIWDTLQAGDKVTLLRDINFTGPISLTNQGAITLNTNGYTLNLTSSGDTLTVSENSQLTVTGTGAVNVSTTGTGAGVAAVRVRSRGVVTGIHNVTAPDGASGAWALHAEGAQSGVSINGNVTSGYSVHANTGATVTVAGSTSTYFGLDSNAGTIMAGAVTATVRGLYAVAGATVTAGQVTLGSQSQDGEAGQFYVSNSQVTAQAITVTGACDVLVHDKGSLTVTGAITGARIIDVAPKAVLKAGSISGVHELIVEDATVNVQGNVAFAQSGASSASNPAPCDHSATNPLLCAESSAKVSIGGSVSFPRAGDVTANTGASLAVGKDLSWQVGTLDVSDPGTTLSIKGVYRSTGTSSGSHSSVIYVDQGAVVTLGSASIVHGVMAASRAAQITVNANAAFTGSGTLLAQQGSVMVQGNVDLASCKADSESAPMVCAVAMNGHITVNGNFTARQSGLLWAFDPTPLFSASAIMNSQQIPQGGTITVSGHTSLPGTTWLGLGLNTAGVPMLKPATVKSVTQMASSTTKAGYLTYAQGGSSIWIRPFPVTVNTPRIPTAISVGQKVSVASGTWPVGTKLTYQWLRGTTPIGTNAASYTPVAADVGKVLSVKVSAVTPPHHVAVQPRVSNTVTVAKSPSPSAPVAPAVTAKTSTSVTLKANARHEFSKDGVTWQRSGTFTRLAPGTRYSFHQRVKETASTHASAKSTKRTVTTTPGTFSQGRVSLSGTAGVGKKLTAQVATTTRPSATRYRYQWYRSGKSGAVKTVVTTAKKSYYTLVKADVGKKITVKVTAIRTGYTSKTFTKTTARIS